MTEVLRKVRRAAVICTSVLALGTLALTARPVSAPAKEFVVDEKANAEIAKKLKIPVYFAVPASARAPLPSTIDLPDRMIDFKHPDAKGAEGDVGLRVVVTKRAGMAQRLGKSGLIQTGDILLTVRPEWGGSGPYPNVQMGISHTGLAYVKNGVVYNIDNPMDQEYLGPGYRAQLNSSHYNTLNMLHVIRPRYLTDEQKKALWTWFHDQTNVDKQACVAQYISYPGPSPDLEAKLPKEKLGEFPTYSENKKLQWIPNGEWAFKNAADIEKRWNEFMLKQ